MQVPARDQDVREDTAVSDAEASTSSSTRMPNAVGALVSMGPPQADGGATPAPAASTQKRRLEAATEEQVHKSWRVVA